MMRSFLVFLALCVASFSALAEEGEQLRFGVQTSLNNYKIDDPVGPTANGSGMSISGIALYDVGRESRVMLNVNKESYKLAGSQTNVGQDVSSMGGGLSYQKMLRITRTWKPWVGAGVGYAATTYKNRFVFTPGGAKILYADRETTAMSFLLNANSEWQFNRDWDIGLQAQYARSISDKSSTVRVGIYVVY